MVNCENLYRNDSVQGTLHLVIDNSKFDIKFYKSLNVEVSVEKELSEQGSGMQFLTSQEYIDLSKETSYQGVPKTSQKVVKAVDGQFIPIIPLDHVYPARIKWNKRKHSVTSDSPFSGRSKRRKIIESQDIYTLNTPRYESGGESEAEKENSENFNPVVVVKYETSESLQESIDEGLAAPQTDKNTSTHPESQEGPHPVNASTGAAEADHNQNEQHVHYCKNCCRTFKTSQALKDHRKVKIQTEYNCDDCCEVFPFKGLLEVHKKSHHSSSGASVVYKDKQYWYSCDTCGTLVKTLVKLELHNLSHTGEGYFQCCLCPEKFGERTELSRHLKTHCQRSSGMTRCRWCNEWFASKSALGKHKLVCKEVRCHLCDLVFPNVTSRNIHYKDFHPNDILKCEICNRMFSSKEDLDLHVENHSKLKKKQCTLCGLFYSRLKKHMLVHKNPSQFTEDEIFFCDKCPAKFINRSAFTRHIYSHSGEKPYQCPNCPKTFANCGALYKHMKRHSTLLPYTCEVCGQNCENIEALKEHMMTHSDVSNPFPCALCTQTFSYRNSLKSHMRSKHPEVCAANRTNSAMVPLPQAFQAVEEISTVEAVHEISTATAYTSTDANGILEVVIPGLADLNDANGDPPQFEIVIVEEKPEC